MKTSPGSGDVKRKSTTALANARPVAKSVLRWPGIELVHRHRVLESLGFSVLCYNVAVRHSLTMADLRAWCQSVDSLAAFSAATLQGRDAVGASNNTGRSTGAGGPCLAFLIASTPPLSCDEAAAVDKEHSRQLAASKASSCVQNDDRLPLLVLAGPRLPYPAELTCEVSAALADLPDSSTCHSGVLTCRVLSWIL